MLITGDQLNDQQRRQVLAAYVHRWTHENAKQTYQGRCPACVQSGGDHEVVLPPGQAGAGEVRKRWHDQHLPMVSDREWLAAHAFHFVKDGSRLHGRYQHAEPAYLAVSA